MSRAQILAAVDVIIDPGHGGSDPGAVNPDGTTERDEVMACGLSLRYLLRKRGLSSRLTRGNNTDPEPTFADRVRGSGRLYVSLHMDCWQLFSQSRQRHVPCVGWWVLHGRQPGSAALAESITASLETNPLVGVEVRVEPRPRLYISSFVGPAVLVELGRVRHLTRPERVSLIESVIAGLLPHLGGK